MWIGYREATTGTDAFKVSGYYHTDWMNERDLPLKVDGLNLDAVYENFVRQLTGDALRSCETEESLQDAVRRSVQRTQLEKQVAALQAKIRRERQLNKQTELNSKLKQLKKELGELH